jgi:predicted alpha/beta hydrolase family esterase
MSRPLRILIQPGYTNSGPDHWQSAWERAHPEYERVLQHDWDEPYPEEWVGTFLQHLLGDDRPAIIVAHSLGCITVAKAAPRCIGRIAGALLVAPCDVEQRDALPQLRRFAPMPGSRLPFPSMLVASRNDPFLGFRRAEILALEWGSELIDAGDAGHIATADGYGPWPEGEWLLQRLLETVGG